MAQLEAMLDVQLPDDFRRVGEYFDGTGLEVSALLPFTASNGQASVGGATLQHREELGLPAQFVVLAVADESIVALAAKTGEIHWMHRATLAHLCLTGAVEGARTWPNFTAFLTHAVDEEES